MGTWHSDSEALPKLSRESSITRGTVIPEVKEAQVGVCSRVGRRSYQEDRHTVTQVGGEGKRPTGKKEYLS